MTHGTVQSPNGSESNWGKGMSKPSSSVTRTVSLIVTTIACLCFSAQAQAPLDVRIALVIGNSAYPNAPLVNPANDARAMGDTLRGLGFTVIELRDAQKTQMAEAIAKVRADLNGKQGVGMLYYAGHGLQLDWRNYMVPVDAKLTKASEVAGQTVDINLVIDAFKGAGNRMNILVLDACRDNPFAGTSWPSQLHRATSQTTATRKAAMVFTPGFFWMNSRSLFPRSRTFSSACGCRSGKRARAVKSPGSQPVWKMTSFSILAR
jgi:hypothetical protein